ncbi:hypothetical protein GY45DRAFT_564256 [Cubamyces sp. BRFM 1775]|nr:hypothetical protein GY45DRAFT_564256 [Cubamyces sp. BRFM 1775]
MKSACSFAAHSPFPASLRIGIFSLATRPHAPTARAACALPIIASRLRAMRVHIDPLAMGISTFPLPTTATADSIVVRPQGVLARLLTSKALASVSPHSPARALTSSKFSHDRLFQRSPRLRSRRAA